VKRISTKAIILRRVNYGEADRILTTITLDQGKVSLFARGARRAKSRLAGGLELFSVSDVVFIDGKNDLKTIVSARLDRHFTDIARDIDAAMQAYDFLKLIDENTQDSCDGDFFILLKHSLEALSSGNDLQLTKTWFYTQLLRLTGRSINLEAQIDGKEFKEAAKYIFDFEDMGFAVNSSGQFSSKHIKFLRLLGKVDSPANLLKVEGANTLADELVGLSEQCFRDF